MLKIGRIDYINNLPLFAPLLTGDLPVNGQIIHGVPTQLNQQLHQGELDIAIISGIEFLRNQDQYILIPSLGVGARERVMSITLYIKDNLELQDIKKIGLTIESASSVQLVKILCTHFWKIAPEFIQMPDIGQAANFDAFLLIGDKALLHPSYPGYRTLDLATVWHQATGLGMAFGIFAIRQQSYDTKKNEILDFYEVLHKAWKWTRVHSDTVLALAREKCPLNRDTIEEYFRVLRFELEAPEMNGLMTYSTYSGIPYSPNILST